MRYLYILVGCSILLSCNAKQKLLIKKSEEHTIKYCPEDGVCTFEVLQNSSLKLLKDGIGKLYPEISEGNKIILKYEYKRNEIPNSVDGDYSELIYIETDPNNLEINVKDSLFNKAKVLFARLCFCRGQTGYYRVNEGNLSITEKADIYQFNLEFKVDEVPQIITSIHHSFRLK